MTFRISAGVYPREIDLTGVVPAVASSTGGFAGKFSWGPVESVFSVSNEDDLIRQCLKPTDATRVDWLTAASFLSYSNALLLSRVFDPTESLNASTGQSGGATPAPTGVLVKNDGHYEDGGISYPASTEWVAKHFGTAGNSLQVITIANKNAYDNLVLLSTTGTDYQKSLYTTIVSVIAGKFPKTSAFAADRGALNDEMHIFVVDEDGTFSGTPGTILESYIGVSQGSDALTSDGLKNYYKDVINQKSLYLRWVAHDSALSATNIGTAVTSGKNYAAGVAIVVDKSFGGGADGTITEADYISAYGFFSNPDTVDVNLIFMGAQTSVATLNVIQNIAEVRKDCVVFCSPPRDAVVNNTTPKVDVITYRDAGLVESPVVTTDTLLGYSTSYAFLDNNWKYMFDRHNDKYAWVPCNGDTAGLAARTDNERDPWWSIAGFNRGNIKNAIKLAWSAKESERDQLYQAEVNPIVSFPGLGTVLFGDKTMLARPSAFDRINVRRLFIVLEKAISTAAKFSLFEFNDQFTRAQFVSLIEPFLREVQGRRGITAFKVVCDESNNTGQVIDSNSFVGDIFIKPARSVNYIQLNFVSVNSDVSFDEIVGAV